MLGAISPKKGDYILYIYAKENKLINEDYNKSNLNVYECLLRYRVKVKIDIKNSRIGFPENCESFLKYNVVLNTPFKGFLTREKRVFFFYLCASSFGCRSSNWE